MKTFAFRVRGLMVSAACVGFMAACGGGGAQQRKDEKPVQQKQEEQPQDAAPAAPTEPEVEMDLSAGLKRPPPTRNPSALAALEEAAGVYKQAGENAVPAAQLASIYQRAVQADPSCGVCHFNLGVVQEFNNQLQEAEQSYRKAVSLDPALDAAVANLGALLERRNGGDEQARKLYKAVLDKNPRSVGARIRLGQLALQDNKPGDALDYARQALGFEPRSLEAYRLLARGYLAQKQYSLAKLMVLRGLKLQKDDPDLTVTMGEVLMAEKDPAAGLATMQKAVATDGNQLKARFTLAQAAMESRDYAGAAEQYREIIKRDPSNMAAFYNLGLALQGQGRFADARLVLQAAIKQKPDAPEPHLLLADISMRNTTQYAEAKESLRAYMKLKGSVGAKHPAQVMLSQVDELMRQEAEQKRLMEEMRKQEEAEAAAAKAEEERLAKEEEERLKKEAEEAAKAQQAPPADGAAPAGGDAPPADAPPADAPPAGAPPG